jgi:hypothetical protein
MMHGREKSDSAIVAAKPTNKGVPSQMIALRCRLHATAFRDRHETVVSVGRSCRQPPQLSTYTTLTII